jgi:hypothetical protein
MVAALFNHAAAQVEAVRGMDMMRRCNILAAALVALGTMSVPEAPAQSPAPRTYAFRVQEDDGWLRNTASREAGKLPRTGRRAAPVNPVPAEKLCTAGFNTLVYHPPEDLAKGLEPSVILRRTAHAVSGTAWRIGGGNCGNGLPVRWT